MRNVDIIESRQYRATIARPVRLEGLSVLDFQPCSGELLPAPAGSGIVFEVGGVPIALKPENLVTGGPEHTTTLAAGGARVLTIEHFLAAVNAASIDDLLVRTGKRGLPLPDFSAAKYAEALAAAGRAELPAKRRVYRILREFSLDVPGDGRRVEFRPVADGRLELEAVTVFGPPIGTQTAAYREGQSDFQSELAWARSFVPRPLDDAGDKWERVRRRYPVLPADPKDSPLLAFNAGGFITPLRRPDEPGRHKLVDLMGDLMLAGRRVAGGIRVIKPGHSFNAAIARRLGEEAGD